MALQVEPDRSLARPPMKLDCHATAPSCLVFCDEAHARRWSVLKKIGGSSRPLGERAQTQLIEPIVRNRARCTAVGVGCHLDHAHRDQSVHLLAHL